MDKTTVVMLPNQPFFLQEGTYRIEAVPFDGIVHAYEHEGRHGETHERHEALVLITSTIDKDGHEDTDPKVARMGSQLWEMFVRELEAVERHGGEYDPREFKVTIARTPSADPKVKGRLTLEVYKG